MKERRDVHWNITCGIVMVHVQGVPKKWCVSLLQQQANAPFFLGQPVGMMTARHKGVGFWGLMSMTALIPLIIIFQEPMWTETELQTELQILYYEKIDILKNPSYLLTFTCCILISTLCTN